MSRKKKSSDRIDPSSLEEISPRSDHPEKTPGKIGAFLASHSLSLGALGVLIVLGVLIGASLKARGYLISHSGSGAPASSNAIISNSSPDNLSDSNSVNSPSASIEPSPSAEAVLGASSDDNSDETPAVAPLATTAPTEAPSGPVADPSHSSLSSNSAPADGSSKMGVTVTLKDGGGHALAGQSVSLSSADAEVNFYPASAVTNSSGQASFNASSYSSIPETVNAAITGSGTTINLVGLGTITFNSLGSASSSSTSSSAGNSNCTTGPGVPNFWYSESSISTGSTSVGGSATITVQINDCNKTQTNAVDNLSVCLTSSNTSTSCSGTDSSAKVNGNSPPVSISTQNGSASFSVTSQNSGQDYYYIYDTTNHFALTDSSNHNPGITFTGSSNPAPTSTPTPSSTPSPSPSPSPS